MEEIKMICLFKINGKIASRKKIKNAIYCLEQNEENEISELFETGSVDAQNIFNEGNADATIQIVELPNLDKETIKLALFSTLSCIGEDSPDGLPERYHQIFKRLGNELIDMDIDYDKVLTKLVKLAEVIQ